MSIDLSNLQIEKFAIHTVPKRTPERTAGKVTYARKVLKLPAAAAATVTARITEALGRSSHSVEVAVVDHSASSFGQLAVQLMHGDDDNFLAVSRDVADKLATAQASRDLAASKLIVATGRAGLAKKKYLLVIKAEMSDGFTEDNESGIEHLTELFLTPTQKLFKMGIISEVVSAPAVAGLYNLANYAARIFDHLLTGTESRDAAQYFYYNFLGTQPVISDKRLTRDFFELTKSFINSAPISQDDKSDLLDALRVELKSNNQIIHISTFAVQHMNDEQQEEYVAFMKANEFPGTAITKDTEFVKLRMRRKQKIKFEHGVEVIAPADKMSELVHVDDENAQKTVLTIYGSIEERE